jgi:Leucine-rich repeat (LRR) protein
LTNVPLNIFDPLSTLQQLVMSHNALGNMIQNDDQGRLFAKLIQLQSLRLDNSHIEHLHNKTFQNLINLTKLYLDYNEIVMWDYGTFAPVKSIKYIGLSHNLISSPSKDSVVYFLPGTSVNMSANPFNCWCNLSSENGLIQHQ